MLLSVNSGPENFIQASAAPHLAEGFDGDDVVGGRVSLHQACFCQRQDALHRLLRRREQERRSGYTPRQRTHTRLTQLSGYDICASNCKQNVTCVSTVATAVLITRIERF